jgi:hypothetical protein
MPNTINRSPARGPREPSQLFSGAVSGTFPTPLENVGARYSRSDTTAATAALVAADTDVGDAAWLVLLLLILLLALLPTQLYRDACATTVTKSTPIRHKT